MAKGKIKARGASYLKEFQCIGGICEDNCCIGWNVEIDEETYGKYRDVKDSELNRIIRKYVYLNEGCYDKNVDYGLVELLKNRRCPFLNKENLCSIQLRKGEDYLSNVCASYPRLVNLVDGTYEYSATVSCPEIARLALSTKEGIQFEEMAEVHTKSNIISISVNTQKKNNHPLVKYLKETRAFTISLLQDRSHPLRDRILLIGLFYSDIQGLIDQEKTDEILNRINQYSEEGLPDSILSQLEKFKKQSRNGEEILKDITERFNNPEEIDSERYFHYISLFWQGLKKMSTNNNPPEYILENYLVNYVFQSLFPASEGMEPLEAFQKLAIRYSLIRFYLKGILAVEKNSSEKTSIEFIQVFSKALEHHYTYFDEINEFLNREGTCDFNSLTELIS